MGKEYSTGIKEVYPLAVQEAIKAGSRFIEREQMLSAICSLEEVPVPTPDQYIIVPSYLGEFEKEKGEIKIVFSHFSLDPIMVRRKIRAITVFGDFSKTANKDEVIHRSQNCKMAFVQAESLSSSNKVTVLHLLAAILTDASDTIDKVFQTFQIKSADIARYALETAEPKPPQAPPPQETVVFDKDKEPVASEAQSQLPETIKTDKEKKRTRLFIVHGHDLTPALALKAHLNEALHLNAEMFSARAKGSKTIIETLEEIKETTAFAFIIMTPDDLGNTEKNVSKKKDDILIHEKISRKDVTEFAGVLKPRARQNVIFEYGLFMGALERNKTCCLMRTANIEQPSDISGLLFLDFTEDISERFTDIESKLQESGLLDPKIKKQSNKNLG